MMDAMGPKADASSVVLLLIPTSIVVAGLVGALVVRSLPLVLSMLLLLGAILLGFWQSRRAQRRGLVDRGR